MPIHDNKTLMGRLRRAIQTERFGILSIRNRLLVSFVVVALLPSLVVSFNAIRFGRKSLLDEKRIHLFSLSNSKMTQLTESIGDFKNQIFLFSETGGHFAEDIEFFAANPFSKIAKSKIQMDFDQFLYHNPAFLEIFLIDPVSGTVSASSNPDGAPLSSHAGAEPDLPASPIARERPMESGNGGRPMEGNSAEGSIHSNLDYFIDGKKGFVSDLFRFSPAQHDFISTFALPIRNRYGELLSVAVARLNHEFLNEFFVQNHGLGETGISYVVNREGRHVAGIGLGMRPPSPQGPPLFDHPVLDSDGIRNALSNIQGGSAYENFAHKPVLGYYQPLPVADAGILVEQDLDEVLIPIRDLQRIIVIYSLLALAIALIMAKLVSSKISKPIVELAHITTEIASGKRVSIPLVAPVDEIGMLNLSVSQMTDHLLGSLGDTRQIIETMPDALFIVDSNGAILSANSYAYGLTGYSRHEMEGFPLSRLVRFANGHSHLTRGKADKRSAHAILEKPPLTKLEVSSDNPETPFHLSLLSRTGVATDVEMLCVPKKGAPIPILLSGALLPGRGRQPNRTVVIVQDLRRQRHYAKERLNAIVPALSRMSLGDFSFKLELPPQNDEFMDLVASLQLMADNLRELVDENQNKAAEILASSLKLQKSHAVLQKSKRSIEAEKSKADALLGSIGEGIVAIDLQGKILLMNQQAERLFERDTRSVLGLPFTEHFNLEDQSGKPINLRSEIVKHVVIQKIQHFTTTYFVRPNAQRLPLATTLSPILLGKKVMGIIGTFRDITRELEIDKAKSEFVSLASHQLRTPLTAVKWLLEELIRKGGFNKTQADYLVDIQTSTERLITLVNDLLNVSRLESGVFSIESKKTDVVALVADIVREYQPVASEKHQSIHFAKNASPITLNLDSELYRQIVGNLLSNSIKYSLEGKSIDVSVFKTDKGVSVSVRDRGIGMTSDELNSIFQKFFRSSEAAKFSTTSSGLGLYIVNKILDLSGGTITVKSEKDEGSEFIFTYPPKGMKAHAGTKRLA